MRTTQEIAESIDNRLRELNDEIKTLDAARVALDGREDRPSRRRPAGVTKRRSSAPRASSRTKASTQSKREASAHVVSEPASRPTQARSQNISPKGPSGVERHNRRPARVAAIRQRRADHVRACRASRREPRPRAQAAPRLGNGWPDPPDRPTPRDALARDHRRGPHPRARRRTGGHAQAPHVTAAKSTNR